MRTHRSEHYQEALASLELARQTSDERMERYYLQSAITRALLALCDALSAQRWQR